MPTFQSRAWCFTLNNPSFPAEDLPSFDHERYVSWQLERGANGTPHIQGYIELTKPQSLAAMKRWLPTAHWEKREGTPDEARDYTRKEDSREEGPFERGSFGGSQGKRTDLANAVDALRAGGMKRVREEHPTAYVKFHRGLHALAKGIEADNRETDDDFVPRPWQSRVLDLLKAPADDRHIIWVTDTQGNKGKSRLARHLVLNHKAVILEGRVQDMAYAYNKEPIVVIDITRAQADNTKHLYSFAEKLKNGMLVSTKYESEMKIFKPPHVIFFSNTSWDEELWSQDRVKEIDLNNPDNHVVDNQEDNPPFF